MLGILYADVFDGTFAMIGANHYATLPVPGEPGKVWRESFLPPPGKMLRHAKFRNRYVFLSGETDFNRPQNEATAHAYEREKYRHVTHLLVPGLGHWIPDAEWFGRGIDFLDVPLRAEILGNSPQSRAGQNPAAVLKE